MNSGKTLGFAAWAESMGRVPGRLRFPGALFVVMAVLVTAGALRGTPVNAPRSADLCGVPVTVPADLRIVRATPVPAGATVALARTYRPTRAFCRVEGLIEAEIGFELWLPDKAAWNRRFLGAGVGGQAGNFAYPDLARGVERGYATASTDTGHKAADETWLLGRPDRAANYAERANHLLAERGKALTRAYFGQPARTALFVGCSGGGRQAMTELQRFPDDYDGILAGAPGVNTPQMSARRLWEMLQHDRYTGVLDAAGWKRIAAAGVSRCDAADGLRDGIVTDPTTCPFRPRDLACRPGQAAGQWLSPAQVALAERVYAPLRDENGRRIDPGILPGTPVSPVAVPEPFAPGPKYLATVLFGQGIYKDANWDVRKFRIARDLPAIDRVMNLHADSTAIEPFVRRGGKLILYQGGADPLVAAVPTIAYYRAVGTKFGRSRARQFARLYMVPGMDHCRGGGVPDRFGGAGGLDGEGLGRGPDQDMLTALEQWVEHGRAPGTIVAAQIDGGAVTRTRPLCPWPQQSRYVKGDPMRASSFVCAAPRGGA